MIKIPICAKCNKYNPESNSRCFYCNSILQKGKFSSQVERDYKFDTDHSKTKISDKNNIPLVNPPPVPKKVDFRTEELMKNIQISIKTKNQPSTDVKKTILFRRGLIIVFERLSFELFLQQPWIKKILGNEIQVRFERQFSNDQGPEHIIETILRLKIIYTRTNTESLPDFLSDKSVHDEMAFKINQAFVVVKDSPLSTEWYNFLTQKSNSTFIYYLTRNQLDQKIYDNYSLVDSELLFIALIKRLLVINDQIEIKIVDQKARLMITDIPKQEPNITYTPSNLQISDAIVNCMGHGGAIEKYYTCKTCGGSLCAVCLDSFLICPGSISTELHKFIKK